MTKKLIFHRNDKYGFKYNEEKASLPDLVFKLFSSRRLFRLKEMETFCKNLGEPRKTIRKKNPLIKDIDRIIKKSFGHATRYS